MIVHLTRFTILGEVRYSKPVDGAVFETGLRIAEANWKDENTPVAVEDLEAWRILPVEEERLIA